MVAYLTDLTENLRWIPKQSKRAEGEIQGRSASRVGAMGRFSALCAPAVSADSRS
jgi:hypothetical protein